MQVLVQKGVKNDQAKFVQKSRLTPCKIFHFWANLGILKFLTKTKIPWSENPVHDENPVKCGDRTAISALYGIFVVDGANFWANLGISKFWKINIFSIFVQKITKIELSTFFQESPRLSAILVVRFGGQLSSPTRVQNGDQKWHSRCRFWSKKVSKMTRQNSSKNQG